MHISKHILCIAAVAGIDPMLLFMAGLFGRGPMGMGMGMGPRGPVMFSMGGPPRGMFGRPPPMQRGGGFFR